MKTNGAAASNAGGSRLGVLSLLSAVLTAGSVAMIGFTSFTAFNPPDWLRIVTMLPLPLVLAASVGFGLAGLKHGAARLWAAAGLVLAGLAVAAFIVMIGAGG